MKVRKHNKTYRTVTDNKEALKGILLRFQNIEKQVLTALKFKAS